MTHLKSFLNHLYTAHTPAAVRFRYALIVFDLFTISYFIAITPFPKTDTTQTITTCISLLILFDFVARFWIAEDRKQHALRVYVWADAVVLAALFLDPITGVDLSFLRILRGLRLGHSHHLLQDLRAASSVFRRREETIVAAVNLFVFVFVTSSGVYTFFGKIGSGVSGYIDAIYFTVTTLTTTGYGDLTPTTPAGKLVSVVIMVVGVALFVHLARSIVMPLKVRLTCQACGLNRHDADAVRCKHCGEVIHIKNAGDR
ncbi:two pore domain potassium channel family protein [Shimia litoralis]|uniref:Two pore domain potassium channel family protein n=1 Tax=Shimia litoralis TaxID=420403 RepID=A0A4U7MT61_9RHOB|nr:ion channel [Shimia litoralis]TKZ15936.1 two pore domain potassium channel family protein [Shimia litoralis]